MLNDNDGCSLPRLRDMEYISRHRHERWIFTSLFRQVAKSSTHLRKELRIAVNPAVRKKVRDVFEAEIIKIHTSVRIMHRDLRHTHGS